MGTFRKSALAIGTAAILATSVTPAMAAVSLERGKSVLKASGEYDGWGRRRYRHRDRVDGGDILAGIAILASIAIVADAASKGNDRSRVADRYPTENYPDSEPSTTQDGDRAGRINDVGSAVEACSSAAERNGARVDEIRGVTRDGEGWRVEGDLSGGADDSFTCGATNGEVDFVQYGDRDI